ncbi:hypothetical protein DMC30DRAFT_390346 [Rhodotorula diobovata]|uniref:Uncharacterized protein n=1 Tax=Rhodotorula diobovata TaxID=5288 RepID=A0A5C5G454_9BASI|nr:hypothetical protein DMC30DRAFT_390346 [Rhodotorula diobovata]
MSRQGDRPHRRRRSPHDLQVGSSSAEPHKSMEDFERRIDQITGELDRLGVNDRDPRKNTERREKSQELEAAVQSYVHHLQDSQSPPREGDPARRGAVAAQGGQMSTDALGGDHTWSERELQDHVHKIHSELASLKRVQDDITAKVRPKKKTPAKDEPQRTDPVGSEPRNASRSPLTEHPFVSRLDADDDNVEDEESLDRLDRNLFGRRRSLGFPALPGEPKDTIRQEIAELIERLERSHPDAQGRLALQEALARKVRLCSPSRASDHLSSCRAPSSSHFTGTRPRDASVERRGPARFVEIR